MLLKKVNNQCGYVVKILLIVIVLLVIAVTLGGISWWEAREAGEVTRNIFVRILDVIISFFTALFGQ